MPGRAMLFELLVLALAVAARAIHSSGHHSRPDSPATKAGCEPERVNQWWVDQSGELLAGMAGRWREGDIVVSAPAKSGTTWAMNIVHQLRAGGDEQLQDLYAEVPWLEFFETPYQTKQQLYTRWGRLPRWYPRAFKTHAEPPRTPYNSSVRYVVVMRDPRDAISSFLPFLHTVTDEAMDYWDTPPSVREQWFRGNSTVTVMTAFAGYFRYGQLFTDFLKGWWPYRHATNVLLLHYSDMKADRAGSVRKVYDFLGFSLTPSKLDRVVELTSFEYMKKHGGKYTMQTLDVSIWEPTALTRTGKVGGSSLPAEVLSVFDEVVQSELEPEQLQWLLAGGLLAGSGQTELTEWSVSPESEEVTEKTERTGASSKAEL